MNKNALTPWVLSQIVLSGLGLFLFHALITKQYRGAPLTLAAWLAAVFILVLVLRRMACNVALESRSRWQRTWAGLDEIGLAFVVFFFLLLVVFDNQYFRATADGCEYFAHVRSLVIDLDLDFANENELFRTGGVPQHFPFGSAVLWLPFYLVAHLWLGLLNLLGGSFNRDGFHNTYQMAVGLGTLTYGFIGLLMIYRIGRDYFAPRIIAAATMLLTAGSFLVWYLAIESSYTHGNSMFAVTLVLLLWYRTRDERSLRQWGWLGLAAGLMVMVRWQNAVFLLFPAVDAATMLMGLLRNAPPADGEDKAPSDTALSLGRSLAVFGLGLFFGFLPQMNFWRVVNGGWLALPHGQAGQQWWSESLMVDVLFSSNHGLLAWHPIIYLAVLGIPLFLLRDFRLGGLLTLVFLIQIYINGAVATWWGGHAFGGRRFASCALLFALGLAAFIRFLQERPLTGAVGTLSILVVINAFFIADIKAGRLPTGQGIKFNDIVGASYRQLGNPVFLSGQRAVRPPARDDRAAIRRARAADVQQPAHRSRRGGRRALPRARLVEVGTGCTRLLSLGSRTRIRGHGAAEGARVPAPRRGPVATRLCAAVSRASISRR